MWACVRFWGPGRQGQGGQGGHGEYVRASVSAEDVATHAEKDTGGLAEGGLSRGRRWRRGRGIVDEHHGTGRYEERRM